MCCCLFSRLINLCYPKVARLTQISKFAIHIANLEIWVEHFKGYGKDALLLTLLAYNVGVGRLLGYGKHPKSRLLRKIESGDRNFYREYVVFCRCKGQVLRGLVKRRHVEFALFYVP
ncbi:glycoside hydrolase family protein [Prevotella koreensis]